MQLVRGVAEDTEYLSLMDKLGQDLGKEATGDLQTHAAKSDLEEIIGLISRMRGKRSRALTGWASLTPTEQRVVSLATEGLSNPQIAERMFIARGTVKIHLSHIVSHI
jgi:DNA-binding CsgD family transcriptional regulator